jgi:hypothetical protein
MNDRAASRVGLTKATPENPYRMLKGISYNAKTDSITTAKGGGPVFNRDGAGFEMSHPEGALLAIFIEQTHCAPAISPFPPFS